MANLSWCFPRAVSFRLHNSPSMSAPLGCPLHRWGNGGRELESAAQGHMPGQGKSSDLNLCLYNPRGSDSFSQHSFSPLSTWAPRPLTPICRASGGTPAHIQVKVEKPQVENRCTAKPHPGFPHEKGLQFWGRRLQRPGQLDQGPLPASCPVAWLHFLCLSFPSPSLLDCGTANHTQ